MHVKPQRESREKKKCNFTKMQQNVLEEALTVITHGVGSSHRYANFSHSFKLFGSTFLLRKCISSTECFITLQISQFESYGK